MKLSQLFYLPNEWYAAAVGGVAGLLATNLVDWVSGLASLLGEAMVFAALTMVVSVGILTAGNFFARLRNGRWPADA